jgi:hypothetical protein
MWISEGRKETIGFKNGTRKKHRDRKNGWS